LIKIDDFIVEVIPYEGVEVGEQELNEYHGFYNQLKHPVGVLVNKERSYSYSFSAQMNIAKYSNIAAIAILAQDPSKYNKEKYTLPAIKGDAPLKLFSDCVTALDWLNSYNKNYTSC